MALNASSEPRRVLTLLQRHATRAALALVALAGLTVAGAAATRTPAPVQSIPEFQFGIEVDPGPIFVPEFRPEPRQRFVDCPPGTRYSARRDTCIIIPRAEPRGCPPGEVFSERQGRCVFRAQRTEPPRPPRRNTEVVRLQECLNRLGFDAGPADGAAGRRTVGALVAFQRDNGLSARPANVNDDETLKVLFDLCARPNEQVAAIPVPPEQPVNPPAGPVSEPPVAAAPATPIPVADRCLEPDLYDMLQAAYGPRPGVSRCASACLPKPAFLSPAQLTQISAEEGVTWCEACIQLGAYLPLSAVLEIEAAANVTLCASPPQACFLPGRPVVQTVREVKTIYEQLPPGIDNDGDVAVIIGNTDYGEGIPPNSNGQSDADAMKELLIDQLGYRPQNVIDLRNATKADFARIFGTAQQPGEIQKRLTDAAESDLVVYISAHGLAEPTRNAGYILPVDGDADDLDATGVPLQELYQQIGRIGARTTMFVLEASFARNITQLIDPPNLPELDIAVLPATPVPGLAVFKASDRDQRALQDPEYGIGLFTRYLIAGLAGEADAGPIGNGDKRIDTVELFVYTADRVRTAARKSFGLEQKPLLSRIDNLLIGQVAAN